MARRGVTVMLVTAPAMALALVLAGCGGDDDGSAGGGGAYGGGSPATTTAATTAASGGAVGGPAMDVSGMTVVDMELKDDVFAPALLRGTPGQAITIDLDNTGAREHNFSIEAQDVDTDVEPGETATVKVTFPDSGTLDFVCEYHEANGMVGSLEVPAS
jgi:plastocyanin